MIQVLININNEPIYNLKAVNVTELVSNLSYGEGIQYYAFSDNPKEKIVGENTEKDIVHVFEEGALMLALKMILEKVRRDL